MKTISQVGLLFCLNIGLLGCGSGVEQPEVDLVPVSGTVTMDNKPLSNASVRFIPIEGLASLSCTGVTDTNGKFTLRTRNADEGCPTGKFKVVISKFARQDGTPLPDDLDGATAAAAGMEHIPPKYSNSEKSELTAEVPEGGKEDFQFDLKV